MIPLHVKVCLNKIGNGKLSDPKYTSDFRQIVIVTEHKQLFMLCQEMDSRHRHGVRVCGLHPVRR